MVSFPSAGQAESDRVQRVALGGEPDIARGKSRDLRPEYVEYLPALLVGPSPAIFQGRVE